MEIGSGPGDIGKMVNSLLGAPEHHIPFYLFWGDLTTLTYCQLFSVDLGIARTLCFGSSGMFWTGS